MTKWEYQLLDVALMGADDIQKRLNTLGGEGWELVATTQVDGKVQILWLKKSRW